MSCEILEDATERVEALGGIRSIELCKGETFVRGTPPLRLVCFVTMETISVETHHHLKHLAGFPGTTHAGWSYVSIKLVIKLLEIALFLNMLKPTV